MMSPLGASLSQRNRRALIAGLLVIGLLIGGKWTLSELPRLHDDSFGSAERAAIREGVVRQLVLEYPAARDSLAVRRARLAALDSAIFIGASHADVAVKLVERVASAADESSVELGPAQVQWDSLPQRGRPHPLTRVQLRTNATGDLEGLATFLEHVESGPELLSIRDLTLSHFAASVPSRAASLRAELTIEALVRLSTEGKEQRSHSRMREGEQ